MTKISKSKHDCTSHKKGRRAIIVIRVVMIVRGTPNGESSVKSKRVKSKTGKSKYYTGKSSEIKTKKR